MDRLRELTPGGGCYMNEADYLEENWQTAFFGTNYDRLLRIKQQYDPSNFLIAGNVLIGMVLMSKMTLSDSLSFHSCLLRFVFLWYTSPQYSCYNKSANPLVFTNPL